VAGFTEVTELRRTRKAYADINFKRYYGIDPHIAGIRIFFAVTMQIATVRAKCKTEFL